MTLDSRDELCQDSRHEARETIRCGRTGEAGRLDQEKGAFVGVEAGAEKWLGRAKSKLSEITAKSQSLPFGLGSGFADTPPRAGEGVVGGATPRRRNLEQVTWAKSAAVGSPRSQTAWLSQIGNR